MKKTLLSIMAAVSVIASGSALADSSLVEVYGTFNIDLENVKATGSTAAGTTVPGCALGTCQMVNGNAASAPATLGQPSGLVAPSRNRVTSNSSNIGFRGSEDLGMGTKAIFQIESGISIDNAPATQTGAGSGTASAGNASSGFWATRNSNVGLSSSKWGTVFYGNWDTPYKALTNTLVFDSFYATGIANGNTMIGTPGFGVQSITAGARQNNTGDASFDRRQANSVQYWSPNFAGFSARFVYSANEGRTIEPATLGGTNSSPTIYGASFAYEYGPFRVAYGWEQHRDYFGLTQLGGQAITTAALGANPTSRDNGNKVTLTYKLDTGVGTTTANVAWERLAYNNSETAAGAATDLIHYNRDLIYFALKHQIGDSTIRLGFGDARQGSCVRAGGAASPCSTIGLDARHYAVGYSYSLSKRTDLYTFWTRVNNGAFANYEIGNAAAIAGNITLTTGPGVGAHQQGFGLGIRHVF